MTRYARWHVGGTAVLGTLLSAVGAVAEDDGIGLFLFLTAFVWVASAIWLVSLLWTWRARELRTEYCREGDVVVARHRGRVVLLVRVASVATFGVDGRVTPLRMLFAQSLAPSWPRATFVLRDGSQVDFPPLLLWGRDGEADLRRWLSDVCS